MPANKDVEGGVRGAVGGILLEPLQWHQLLTPKGWKRLTTEGHTFADAILTVAMAQIGMLLTQKHFKPIASQPGQHLRYMPAVKLPSTVTLLSLKDITTAFMQSGFTFPMRHECLHTTAATGLPLLQRQGKDTLGTDVCTCRTSHVGVATSDVPHRHHSWCHPDDCIWLVQHLEHVDSGHLLHGAQEYKGMLPVI